VDDPVAAAAALRRVGSWTWVLIVLGGLSYDLEGGRLSPGWTIGLGGLALAMWRLSKVDQTARTPFVTAALASAVASACSLGPAFGRPAGPALVAVSGVVSAAGLWAALDGFVQLARHLPAICLRLRNVRRGFSLVAPIGAALLAGHTGWEIGGAQPVAQPIELAWMAAAALVGLVFLALQLSLFRVFMALRAAAEMLVEGDGSSDGAAPPASPAGTARIG
jgi:hypothetical protein